MLSTVLAVFVVAGLPLLAQAQTFQNDLKRLLEHRPIPASYLLHQEDAPTPLQIERVSELETLFLATIFLYQTTISSQDTHRCNFTPSCSRFGAAALHHAGLKGILLTSDRLMRDNGMPDFPRYYPFDPKTSRFLDPLDKYIAIPSRANDNEHDKVNSPD
ncbi:MAG: membrane protein insertion efficiency factor YidD [Rhodothermales bacterium]